MDGGSKFEVEVWIRVIVIGGSKKSFREEYILDFDELIEVLRRNFGLWYDWISYFMGIEEK